MTEELTTYDRYMLSIIGSLLPSVVELLAMGVTGATLDPDTGEVTIPAQVVEGGFYVYYQLCDGLVTAILAILISQTP